MARVLVVGGAGYVGSATCAWLLDQGHYVWVLDDLSTGFRELALGQGFTHAKAGDKTTVSSLLEREKFDCVMHFAARSLVSESVHKPLEYFENNVTQTQALLDCMIKAGIRKFVFSSTCAIFGDPGDLSISESLPHKPINPYGETKLKAEYLLQEYSVRHGLQAIALRYFNAAGAESSLRVGECHQPESHLIPLILKAAEDNQPVSVFGSDYTTPDGTCIRDYIHVEDLAQAHENAMKRLLALPLSASGRFEGFNLGSESGFSVKEVIDTCSKVTGKNIQTLTKPRRAGDPPRLVSDSTLAKKELGFTVSRDSLTKIITGAWGWEKKRRATRRKAVFLDRDGTINEDPGYLRHPDQLVILPEVGNALAKLRNAGFALVVVSNQSGVARGLIEPDMIPKINDRLNLLLSHFCARIESYELCFHHPDENCECRKPKPHLILEGARKLGLDVSRSYMVGDKLSDVEAGRNANCKGVALVRTGEGHANEPLLKPGQADFVGNSLVEVADWILNQET